jgi:hypothetical protein
LKNIAVRKYLGEQTPYVCDSVEVKESTLQAAQQAQRAGANKQETKQDDQFPNIRKMVFQQLECRSRSFLNNGSVQAEQKPKTQTKLN